jgi:hypothetical protein
VKLACQVLKLRGQQVAVKLVRALADLAADLGVGGRRGKAGQAARCDHLFERHADGAHAEVAAVQDGASMSKATASSLVCCQG